MSAIFALYRVCLVLLCYTYFNMVNDKKVSLPIVWALIIVLLAFAAGVSMYLINKNQKPVGNKFISPTAMCVPEGGSYGAPNDENSNTTCCSGLVQKAGSPSGTFGTCVKQIDVRQNQY